MDFTYADLKTLIKTERVLSIALERETKVVLCFGYCGKCHKQVRYHNLVFQDQTPKEAFEYYWYSLESDCKGSN